jgi:opacity protein-like surface antigen/cell fate (sporulation/competence/biofilm development) regulator YlbF (YheA/YmcA/DUF963 family)
MLCFVRRCVAGTRGAGLLRAVMTLAAMITIFSILGATVSGNAHAQIAVNRGLDALIPDSPCMTSAERNQLRKMADEYNMLRGQTDNIDAQIEQDSSYKEYSQANDLLNRVAEKGAYESSDEMHAVEAAKKTVARLDRLRKLINRRDALAKRWSEIAGKFFFLVEAIKNRKCPPPAADKEEERQEIGSAFPALPTVFNVGFAGGFTSNQSSIEDFRPQGSGGVLGATFGARWYGLNNSFMGVQGTVLFPFVTQSTNFDFGPTTKLKSLFTQDFQVGLNVPIPTTAILGRDRALYDVYAFIGLAEGNVQANFAPFSDNKTLVGPTVGVGFDVNVAPNVMLFAEGRYFYLYPTNFSLSGAGPVTSVSQQGFMATGGIKLLFGPRPFETELKQPFNLRF